MATPLPAAPSLRERVRVVLSLVLLLLALGAGAVWWWSGRAEGHLAEAERRLNAGELRTAVEGLDLPEPEPRPRDRALILRAGIALARGRPADAAVPLERVDPQGDHAGEAAFWKGRALMAAGNFTLAIP